MQRRRAQLEMGKSTEAQQSACHLGELRLRYAGKRVEESS
jgi:hypothetical protein